MDVIFFLLKEKTNSLKEDVHVPAINMSDQKETENVSELKDKK